MKLISNNLAWCCLYGPWWHRQKLFCGQWCSCWIFSVCSQQRLQTCKSHYVIITRPNLELATIPPSYTGVLSDVINVWILNTSLIELPKDIEKEYYTDPRGDTHFVTGGVLYRFKPPEIDEKTSNLVHNFAILCFHGDNILCGKTCGQFSDLMYTISTNASSAFVQANTGIIVCECYSSQPFVHVLNATFKVPLKNLAFLNSYSLLQTLAETA